MDKKEDEWTEFVSSRGVSTKIKVDELKDELVLQFEGEKAVSFDRKYFEQLKDALEQDPRCRCCKKGSVNRIVITDQSIIYLVCGTCKAVHIFFNLQFELVPVKSKRNIH